MNNEERITNNESGQARRKHHARFTSTLLFKHGFPRIQRIKRIWFSAIKTRNEILKKSFQKSVEILLIRENPCLNGGLNLAALAPGKRG
ncbi:MAG: hypothetical protein IJQ31_04950 [Thermoguttaceae bacterium]|nr:hypothetical protein [Thermoguttaceae bacterium]